MALTTVDESGAGDEFGYPLATTADPRFRSPIQLAATARPADHERHAAAYAACQKRYVEAFRAPHRPGGEQPPASPPMET